MAADGSLNLHIVGYGWGGTIDDWCFDETLTRANTNVVLTARVLDKANPSTVLYQHSVVDTPEADPALTTEDLQNLSGKNRPLAPDLAEAPFTGGGIGAGLWQYNYDGQQPPAVAIFDNLECRKYELPPLGIERAVRLSWFAPTGTNWAVEGAPTVQGPRSSVQALPISNLQQVTVPANGSAQFFRLR